MSCPLCGGVLEPAFHWTEPPEGETRFETPIYDRRFDRCANCGHYAAVHDIDLNKLYEGAYVDATYGGRGIAGAYERVMALPPERSDNVQRVDRIVDYTGAQGTVLDIGSGLGVFPARMKEAGWQCTALDPDPRACEHLRARVGVETVCADFFEVDGLGRFDLVTLNKVLEHVEDPVAMLRRAGNHVADRGFVYVEVPDGERAAAAPEGGKLREEFFIEHLHAFSMESLHLMAEQAGFSVRSAEAVHEPSGKYTLYAFLNRA